MQKTCIGVFDSGLGGLTILKDIVQALPEYDYIYLGDNARSPYGTRSFDTVYEYTLQCVKKLFELGCPLVILACNTASAKALRTIQQIDLPTLAPDRRVLGVIRPTTELLGNYSQTKHIGILATNGTVRSQSYVLEVAKFFPDITIHQQACPLWVPLIENNEHLSIGGDFFVKKYVDELLAQQEKIDTVLLACTHYPLLVHSIQKFLPKHIQLLTQGHIVADSLKNYLQRHQTMAARLTQHKSIQFLTTEDASVFNEKASIFWGSAVQSSTVHV
jgi:glutamate racemase